MSNLLKVRIRKSMNMVSISFSIISVLVAYYVGIEKSRSVQGFLIGMALWLISLSLSIPLELTNRNFSKKESLKQQCLYLGNIIALSWIMPFGVLLPFFGTFNLEKGVLINSIGIYYWINYSLIFTGVFVVAFIIYQIFKAMKNRNIALDDNSEI
ncbi:MAG: hypothetical protein ACI4IE_06550 [Eubacterium sp.]